MAANSDVVENIAIECKVGFIGGGKMAQAIAKGIIAAKIINSSNIMASAKTDETLSKWAVNIKFI